MITPKFTLCQDSKTLTINITAEHCKLGELEVEIIEECFMFSCWPYYLNLTLPGKIIDDEKAKCSYDTDTGQFTFCYTKAVEGEIFNHLDVIPKFFFPQKDETSSFATTNQETSHGITNGVTMTDYDHLSKQGFGFALLGSTHFKNLHSRYFDVFQVDPFKVDLQGRRKLRMKDEILKFNKEHYVSDLNESEIKNIILETAPWETVDATSLNFTTAEMQFLTSLPDKVYNLNNAQVNVMYNTLVDILYAFCYNKRVTNYEENSESGWNIVTLSASLSWLDVFETPREALVFSFRRSLIYPLYRNFELSSKIFEDLKKVLHFGEKFIVKCLIEIYYIFLNGDCCRYILNNLFIKDYINYILKWDTSKWQDYLQNVFSVNIKKTDLGLNLLDLEQYIALDKPMSNLEIKDEDSDDTWETESASETDSTSSDESSDEHFGDPPYKNQ